MGVHLNKLKWAGISLRMSGVLIVVLGAVHLLASPHIPLLVNAMRSDPGYSLARGATLLNHVMTGILLIPLGYTTWLAASPGHLEQVWARRLLICNSLVMLCAPLSVVAFMGSFSNFRAPLFLTGICLATVIPLLMLIAVWWLWRTSPLLPAPPAKGISTLPERD